MTEPEPLGRNPGPARTLSPTVPLPSLRPQIARLIRPSSVSGRPRKLPLPTPYLAFGGRAGGRGEGDRWAV